MNQKTMNRVWYFFFTFLFALEVLAISLKFESLSALQPFQLVLLGFATYRLAHTISWNGVSDWFRFLFTDEIESESGIGSELEPKPGWLYGLGELICCPICSGTHSAMILVSVYCWFPTVGMALAYGLGIAGLYEFVHWIGQSFEWKASESREIAGASKMEKKYSYYEGRLNPSVREIRNTEIEIAVEAITEKKRELESIKSRMNKMRGDMGPMADELINMLNMLQQKMR